MGKAHGVESIILPNDIDVNPVLSLGKRLSLFASIVQVKSFLYVSAPFEILAEKSSGTHVLHTHPWNTEK